MARILVVDDNLLIRTLLREILSSAGHEVIAEARDGDEAITRAVDLRPDLVTLDLVMPRRDGLSTLAQIRHLNPRARVIICSAWLTQPRVTTALRLGAKGFVSKPFDRGTLLAAVDAALAEAKTGAGGADSAHVVRPPDLVDADLRDERREFDRVAVALPVTLLPHDGPPIETWTIDVSGGGMLVDGSGPPGDAQVGFQLALGPGEPRVEGTARIARAPKPDQCALAFEAIRAEDHERLIGYLARQRSATARLGALTDLD
jgi:two-component system, chemotaxis family, chemotaxis protein CheY